MLFLLPAPPLLQVSFLLDVVHDDDKGHGLTGSGARMSFSGNGVGGGLSSEWVVAVRARIYSSGIVSAGLNEFV